MADKCGVTWEPTGKEVDKIILRDMQGIAPQCASHSNELQCLRGFMALMLRDIADAFEKT